MMDDGTNHLTSHDEGEETESKQGGTVASF